MKFGVGIPTCREGTAYPVPYVRPREFPVLARHAEALGFDSLWANDHFTTPAAIRATQPEPPNFYEPLVTYAYLASVTERLRLVLSVVVLPQREIVLLAKQIATLDVLSGGRVMLGVGLGSYREEFEAVHPDRVEINRGALLDEGVEALRRLFGERRASFEGRYVRFRDVELAPKPRQDPFPIYVSAREPAALRRAGRLGDGLVVAALPRDRIAPAVAELTAAAAASGRDPARLTLNFQIWCSFGRDAGEAEAKLRRSQHFRRLVALEPGGSEAAVLAHYRAGNLLGSPEDVVAQLRGFEQAGVAHMGIIFLGTTMDELLADMELFATRVMPRFPG